MREIAGEDWSGARFRHVDLTGARFRSVDLRGVKMVDAVHGVRVAVDLVPGSLPETDPGVVEALLRLERAASQLPALRDVATQLHVLAHRP